MISGIEKTTIEDFADTLERMADVETDDWGSVIWHYGIDPHRGEIAIFGDAFGNYGRIRFKPKPSAPALALAA